jgi:hypothetical protein
MFVPHPLAPVYKPNPFSSTAFRSNTATIRYSDRREIDMSPWIYGGITGDFETPRNLTVGKKRKKKNSTTSAEASEILATTHAKVTLTCLLLSQFQTPPLLFSVLTIAYLCT